MALRAVSVGAYPAAAPDAAVNSAAVAVFALSTSSSHTVNCPKTGPGRYCRNVISMPRHKDATSNGCRVICMHRHMATTANGCHVKWTPRQMKPRHLNAIQFNTQVLELRVHDVAGNIRGAGPGPCPKR